jgi:TolB protein
VRAPGTQSSLDDSRLQFAVCYVNLNAEAVVGKHAVFLLVSFTVMAGSWGVNGNEGENSPAIGQIAFVANLNNNWDLFVADESGAGAHQLTDTPFDERSPSWSPDGKHIVYSTSDGRLRIINVDTGEVRLISPIGERSSEVQPAFSPDGRSVVFVVFKGEKVDDSDLAIFDLESDTSVVFFSQRSAQLFPVWSPHGRQIAYMNVHCSMECGRIIQELWTVQARRKTAQQALMTNSQCMQPDWSPDGRSIVFASDKDGDFDIWVYDIETKAARQLTQDTAADTDPCWSPDGEKIAFVSSLSGNFGIYTVDKEGRNLTSFRPFGQKRIDCKDPDWK